MKTTFQSILDALRDLAGSDAKAAPLVGIKQSSFSQWRRGHAYPDDEQAMKIAAALKLAPEYVLAAVRADRTGSRAARAVWLRIAEQFGKAAAVAVVAIGAATMLPSPAADAAVRPMSCVLCKIRRFPFCRCGSSQLAT